MNDFFNNLLAALSAAAPTALWIGRICMAVIAVWLLIRCARSLFSGKREPEVWGFLSLSNGARYDLTHWENVIGRARSCDVRISFPSVSRSHAAVCRGDDGVWQVYPLNQSSGVLLNGKHIFSPTRLQAGDSIAVGGVELYFFPANHEEELRQAERRSRPGHTVSAAGSLWLLSIFQVLTFMQFLPVCTEDYFPKIVLSFAAVGAAGWALYGLYRAMQRTAYELETLVFFLITLGIAVMSAYAPSSLFKQLIAIALGIALFLLLGTALRSLRLAQQLRWPVAAAAAALLAFNVLFGQRIFGAKNWISIGPLSLQPSELVKIAFILAGAATLDRLFAKRNLIFTVLFSAYCVGCLALMSDFGTALVFFVAFLCIAFLRTGDLPSIVMMTAAAGFAGGLMLHFKPYIADRFTVWHHAWEFAQSTGYQQTRTMSAVASGGLFGAGPTDAWLKYVGAANTDLVFGVVSEEFGLLLALCAVAAIILIAVFAITSAATARSSFYTIASCAAAAMLTVQVTLNTLGSVDLLPLTGVTFPFVSMGGSSMLSCWSLMAFLKAADTRQNASFALRLPKRRPKMKPEPPKAKPSNGFFDEIPDIPVDEIFRKEDKPE